MFLAISSNAELLFFFVEGIKCWTW